MATPSDAIILGEVKAKLQGLNSNEKIFLILASVFQNGKKVIKDAL
jgi:hypothetical protein